MADSWDVNSGDVSTLAVPINSTQTTGIKLAGITVNGSTLTWSTTTGGIVLVTENVDGTIKREWINYTGGTDNGDGTFTLTGVTRGVDRDAATRTTATAGQSFNKGAKVQLVVSHLLLNQKADVDRANTFTADQTFNDDILFTGTDKSGVNAKQLTTAERDAISSPNNGAVIYNTTTGQLNQYVGGAWTAVGDTGTVDATESAAGKVEISTKAENAAATATGGSGAVLVPSVEDMVQVSGDAGIAEGSIPVLNSSSKVDVTLLGTGTPSSSNYLRGDGAWSSLSATPLLGDGSDGAKTVSSSEDIDPAAPWNYTTLTINASQTLGVDTVNEPLVILTTSDVTINGTISLDGKGGAGGAAGTATNNGSNGTAGATLISGITNDYGDLGQGNGAGDGSGGGGGASLFTDGANKGVGGPGGGVGGTSISDKNFAWLANLTRSIGCGSGGGGGGGGTTHAGGAGGAGGGSLFMYIGGDLTLGASSIITANGTAGGSGSGTSGGVGAGGGGGGGGTVVIIVKGSITNSGLTMTATGGAAGTAAAGTSYYGGAGGAGKAVIYSIQDGTIITA